MSGGADQTDRIRTVLADRYRFERVIGRGGMATVYLAEDVKLRRPVAVKVLRPELASGLGTARFLREIEITSHLTHPHLLPLHDSGEADGLLWFVTPYVDGETLRARLDRERQLPIDDALRIAWEVAEGLAHAHRHGVLHRDIKPENILLQDGRAILADFGIARAVTASSSDPRTSSGLVIGTAAYMSPEQGSGERELDARSDIYSLGCVTYEMLAGEPPFTGPARVVIARHAQERVPSIRVVRPEMPEAVEAILFRALAKNPGDRHPSADAFARALRDASTPVTAAPSRTPVLRRAMALAAAGVLLTAGLVLARGMLFGPELRRNDWLLVADFAGPPDDPTLAPAVRDLVTAALEDSRFLRVFPRRQLSETMRLAGLPETTYVDGDRARELAQRGSVRAVLLGSVRRLHQDLHAIDLHVVSADDTVTFESVTTTAARPTLVASVERLVDELLERLGDERQAIEATRLLQDVATPSFEAFHLYTQALDAVSRRADFAESNRLLREAIALDSGFASAWAVLATNHVSLRQPDSARLAFTRALAFPDRLTPAQRSRLQGDIAFTLDHDPVAALRWYDVFLEEVPHSRAGRSNRGVYRSALGRYEEALDDVEAALEDYPFGRETAQSTVLNYTALLVATGRLDDARREARPLTGAFARYAELHLACAESRWHDVERLAREALRDARVPGFLQIQATTALAGALASRDAVREADSTLAAAARSSRDDRRRWYERARLLLAVTTGDSALVRALPLHARALLSADTSDAGRMLLALANAASGDTAMADAERRRLSALDARRRATLGHGPTLIGALVAARRGDWRAVSQSLDSIARAGEHAPTALDPPDSYLLRWQAAAAHEALGHADSALALLESMRPPSHIPPGHVALRGIPHASVRRAIARLRGRGTGMS